MVLLSAALKLKQDHNPTLKEELPPLDCLQYSVVPADKDIPAILRRFKTEMAQNSVKKSNIPENPVQTVSLQI